MEINRNDEEKYSQIRHTIRQVILPLVQAIYDQNPSDIVAFCSQYFENLLRKRENEDGGPKIEGEETVPPGTQVQGSSSEPLLTGGGAAGRSVRETSSWDGSPKGGVGPTQTPDRKDIVSGIGDQPGRGVKAPAEDNAQTDSKSGDANFAVKDEEEIFESCRAQENKIEGEPPVLPSAPPYEENDSNRGDAQSGECAHPPEVSRDGEHFTVGEDVKTSSKMLSPNSSFGFIPHLNDYESVESSRREPTEDSSHQDKSPGELQELTVKFSETLQNLAQKFDSAENNLNVEFQKAKEISDIIQGRCQNESVRDDANLVSDLKISNEKTVEGEAHETFYYDNFSLVCDKNNNITIMRDMENNCKAESTDGIEEIASGKEEPDRYTCGLDDSNQSSGKNAESKISQDSELYDGPRGNSSQQNYSDDEDTRGNYFGSRPLVDESWRKRWYEVHPCLDSVDRSFQPMVPRLLRTKRVFTGDRRNLYTHNVGEGGDVPSDAYHFSQRRLFHGPGRNNGSTDDDNSPVVTKPASEIKISLEENESKTASDGDLTEAKSDSALPCTWNKTNQLVDYLETKNYALKQLLETLDDDSKSRPASEDLQVSREQETLSEIVVIKESDKSMKDDLATNQCTLSDNDKAACEHDNLTKFRKDADEKTELSSTKISGSETDVTDEKILSDNNDRDQSEEENYVDVVEVHEKLSEETTNSDVDCHPKECFDKDEINKSPLYRKTERPEDSEESGSKDLSAMKHQRVEERSKVEPGLNSACGDFTSCIDLNSQQAGLANSQHRNLPGGGGQAITAEYVEEIMDRLVQQQSVNDTYEGLNFSSYSDSESSNVESDFSEADDTSLNNEMGEFGGL